MSDQTTACCDQCGTEPTNTDTANAEGAAPTDASTAERDARWLDGDAVLTGPIPADLAATATGFYDAGPVETLGDFADVTRAAAGGTVDVTDLCHVDGETPHRATTGSGTYHFQCFYDGIALARLRSEAVDLRTESPSGQAIEMHVASDGTVDVTPSTAVMSFGIAPDAAATEGGPTPEDVYGAVCPWVKAFPSRDAYEGWAEATDAPTVGLPLTEGTPIAAALVAGE
ncbi:organomercurial lyase [Haloglomus litoreum]|uniref:organomercurial lyase n=1 Tax=Haloglomus litoreum TaxID=3034026 RepID=UPI0023E8E3B3|nr:organomercurial lyase [Haloglomus sp. DT116]